MSEEEKKIESTSDPTIASSRFEKGYQPSRDNLDSSNPPQDGSGITSEDSASDNDTSTSEE